MTIPTPSRAEKIAKVDSVFDIAEQHRLCDPAHCHCWDLIAKALEDFGREANEKADVCAKAHREQYERWEEAENVSESYLQKALRELHRVIEGEQALAGEE